MRHGRNAHGWFWHFIYEHGDTCFNYLATPFSRFCLQHFQKTMPEKYADNFEVVVEEADRMKMSVRKMKR